MYVCNIYVCSCPKTNIESLMRKHSLNVYHSTITSSTTRLSGAL